MRWTCSQILSALHLWIKALPGGVCIARCRTPRGTEGPQRVLLAVKLPGLSELSRGEGLSCRSRVLLLDSSGVCRARLVLTTP